MGPIVGDLTYHFTLHDANVPAGAEFFLDASNLGAGERALLDGSGDATYVYRAVTDSLPELRDRVNGFNAGDRFDLSAMDAKSGTPENDAFTFIGSGAFTGQAGQLRAFAAEDGLTRIEGDVTGDGIADFAIDVSLGGSNFVFQSGDFIL